MSDKDSESFGLGGVNTILPEFYYDLLARIIPGSVSLLAVLVAADVVKPSLAIKQLMTVPIAALLVLGIGGYIVGMVLTYFQSRTRIALHPRCVAAIAQGL